MSEQNKNSMLNWHLIEDLPIPQPEVKPKATCPKCDGKAEFKWIINNPFGKNLTYPEFYCWNCNLYFTVRKDI